VAPGAIGYVAFTRKAANEAIERACGRFDFTPKDLPYFRTLHSLAFRALGLKKAQVLGRKSLQEFGALMGIRITGSVSMDEGQIYGNQKGDRALFLCQLARIKKIDLQEQWRATTEDLGWFEVERIFRGLKEFKEANSLIDFTDMLEQFITEAPIPQLDLLVVDEAQDLSKIQWDMIHALADKAQRVIIAGDDDQAIFRWAGADVDYFINLEGSSTVLGQSHRVPKEIQTIANSILARVGDRRIKPWEPRGADGKLEFTTTTDALDMSEGTWLILARNDFLLDDTEAQCRREGFIYERRHRKSISEKTLTTIRNWETLRAGGVCTAAEARNILRLTTANIKKFPEEDDLDLKTLQEKWGAPEGLIWHKAFREMTLIERSYLVSALKRGETPSKIPRIVLSTIHGAKGGEAENVVLFTDMARRTWYQLRETPEDEHRVFYVGATRARERLIIILPKSKFFFPMG